MCKASYVQSLSRAFAYSWNKKARTAATCLGFTILLTVLWIYLPMLLATRTDVVALNFFFDTLLFCGAILLLANSIDKEPAVAPDLVLNHPLGADCVACHGAGPASPTTVQQPEHGKGDIRIVCAFIQLNSSGQSLGLIQCLPCKAN